MRILYPEGFVFPDMLSGITIPDDFAGALSWQETYVIVDRADEAETLQIKQDIYNAASVAFDPAEENKIIQKRRKVREWIKTSPAIVAFLKATPAEQKTQIEAMNAAQRVQHLWRLSVLVSSFLRDYLED